ncbi:MAG: HYR domain-containing protein [Candidatus Latescibacterota bacterium]
MKRFLVFGLMVVAAAFFACSDSELPTEPTQNITTVSTALQAECGEGEYVAALAPVLTGWEDSIQTWLGGDFLDTPPAYSTDSSAVSYIQDLVPVLTQWEMAINDSLGGDVLDAVPVFGDGELPALYLAALSPVILQWHSALEDSNGTDFLADPPVFTPDETAPVITCAADTIIECADTNGFVVEFEAGAVDECDPAPAVMCEPASGSTFHIGETVVTCTATDFSGNSSQCSFMVTIVEAEPPVIYCPDDITAECTGDGSAPVEFVVTAESECDTNVTVVCDPPSGSIFPLGETVVNCAATDRFGNTVECSFRIYVEDTTPPTINSIMVSEDTLWPPNHKMVDIAVTVDATDICDSEPMCWVYDVTSNEPINGKGDGNTEPDYLIIDELNVQLRAERAGLLEGRVYTLHVRCEDAFGNFADGMVDVFVPHDQGHQMDYDVNF